MAVAHDRTGSGPESSSPAEPYAATVAERLRFVELFLGLKPDAAKAVRDVLETMSNLQNVFEQRGHDCNFHFIMDAVASNQPGEDEQAERTGSPGRLIVACLHSPTLPDPSGESAEPFVETGSDESSETPNPMDAIARELILARVNCGTAPASDSQCDLVGRQSSLTPLAAGTWRQNAPSWYPSNGKAGDGSCDEATASARGKFKDSSAPVPPEGTPLHVPNELHRLPKRELVSFYGSLMTDLHMASRQAIPRSTSVTMGRLQYQNWTPSNAPQQVCLSLGDGTSEIVKLFRAGETSIVSKRDARARSRNLVLATIAYLAYTSPIIAQAVEESAATELQRLALKQK